MIPEIGRKSITSIAITKELQTGDNDSCKDIWSGRTWRALYKADGLILITPFAALLAEKLPKLSHVFMYVASGGDNNSRRGVALMDFHMMLKYGRIKSVRQVFYGRHAARTVSLPNSQRSFEQLMGFFRSNFGLASHEFALRRPPPHFNRDEPVRKRRERCHEWNTARQHYAEQHDMPLNWDWADRNLELDPEHPVQAVISCTRS